MLRQPILVFLFFSWGVWGEGWKGRDFSHLVERTQVIKPECVYSSHKSNPHQCMPFFLFFPKVCLLCRHISYKKALQRHTRTLSVLPQKTAQTPCIFLTSLPHGPCSCGVYLVAHRQTSRLLWLRLILFYSTSAVFPSRQDR